MNDKRSKKSHLYVEPKIDNKAPSFNVSVYLKTCNLYHDATRVKEIDKENIELLKKMNLVLRSAPHVDCWAPDIKYKSNLEDQDRKNVEIMKKNKIMLRKIRQATSYYPTHQYLKDWKSLHQGDKSIIPKETVMLDMQKQLIDKSQTRCFFDIGIKEENQKLGRIVFQLYDTIVPFTCENFAAFCRGINGLSYKHTLFHRIIPGYWCQGGDVTKFNGIGGTSIYGDSFDKENFHLQHTGPGILSMCNNNLDKNDSKFNLTFKRLETADGCNVVFGRVIGGMTNIYKVMLQRK